MFKLVWNSSRRISSSSSLSRLKKKRLAGAMTLPPFLRCICCRITAHLGLCTSAILSCCAIALRPFTTDPVLLGLPGAILEAATERLTGLDAAAAATANMSSLAPESTTPPAARATLKSFVSAAWRLIAQPLLLYILRVSARAPTSSAPAGVSRCTSSICTLWSQLTPRSFSQLITLFRITSRPPSSRIRLASKFHISCFIA
mmetsp:Transcript_43180/g.77384  ORF Transcript_43180/g.77384 Transcript_43180/m.77384 type:complete len:202 (+) Transcript_43180:148-753(+)